MAEKPERIHYDLAFSLGASCASSLLLRKAEMQFGSMPFDWVGGSNVLANAKLLEAGFPHWLDREALELTDVAYTTFNASIYRNRLTGITFMHDFPASCYFDDEFPIVDERYRRRIERFFPTVEKAKRVLAVYCEVPYRPVAAEAEVVEAQQVLARRFPNTRVDLIYFAQNDGKSTDKYRKVNENVEIALVNYADMDHGFVSSAANYMKLIPVFRERFEVTDPRSPEVKAKYAAAEKAKDERRWGKGFQRWLNKKVYHLFRFSADYLDRHGCIPSMYRPLKVYADRGERRPSLSEPDISGTPAELAAARRARDLL